MREERALCALGIGHIGKALSSSLSCPSIPARPGPPPAAPARPDPAGCGGTPGRAPPGHGARAGTRDTAPAPRTPALFLQVSGGQFTNKSLKVAPVCRRAGPEAPAREERCIWRGVYSSSLKNRIIKGGGERGRKKIQILYCWGISREAGCLPAPRIRRGRRRGSGITLQILTRDNEMRSIFQNSKWMGKEPLQHKPH